MSRTNKRSHISELLESRGTISSADITGTGVGQLGHAAGFEMVPAGPAGIIAEFDSLILASDFAVAAYTAGDDLTVQVGNTGVVVSGTIAAASLLGASADATTRLGDSSDESPLYASAKGLNLVTAAAFTNPGTAAGVLHYIVRYRRVNVGLA